MWNDIATRWVDNVSNLLSILIKTISPWHLMVYWKRWKDKSDENASGGPSVVSVKGWTSSRFSFFFFSDFLLLSSFLFLAESIHPRNRAATIREPRNFQSWFQRYNRTFTPLFEEKKEKEEGNRTLLLLYLNFLLLDFISSK